MYHSKIISKSMTGPDVFSTYLVFLEPEHVDWEEGIALVTGEFLQERLDGQSRQFAALSRVVVNKSCGHGQEEETCILAQ